MGMVKIRNGRLYNNEQKCMQRVSSENLNLPILKRVGLRELV
jgi:hypothetical protein